MELPYLPSKDLYNHNTELFGVQSEYERLREYTFNFFGEIEMGNKSVYNKLELTNNVLLSGPPGTGKTRSVYKLVKDLKDEGHDVNLYLLTLGRLLDAELGKTSKNLERIFREAREEARREGVILFIDEIDSIGTSRSKQSENDGIRRAMTSLFLELDQNLNIKNFMTIAATNYVSTLDPALIRRFPLVIEYPAVMDKENFEKYMSYLLETDDIDFGNLYEIVKKRRLSPANIKNACRTVYIKNKDIGSVSFLTDLLQAFQTVHSTHEDLETSQNVFGRN